MGKNRGELGVGNVLVLLNLHGCDRQEATDQGKSKMLVNKPKQELQDKPRSTLTSKTRPPM